MSATTASGLRAPASRPGGTAHVLPAVALLLGLMGYEIFAPMMQALAAESSLPSMVLRMLTIAACVCAGWLHRDRWPPVSYLLLPMLAFLVLYGLRLFDNFFVRGFEWEASPDIAFMFLIGVSLIPAVLLHRLAADIDDDTLLRWGYVSIAVFTLGMVMSWNQILLSFVATRLVMDKLNPISLGYLCTTLLLLLLLRLPRGSRDTLAWSAATLLMMFGIVLSQARGQILALLMLLPVVVWCQPSTERRRLLLLASVPLLLLAATAAWLELDLAELLLDRFQQVDSEASAEGRRDAWAAAWAQFLDSPWLGDRVFEPTLRHYPHNIVLESLIALGLPGAALLLTHLALTLWAVSRTLAWRQATLSQRFVALLAFKELVAAQLSGAIWSDNTFWIASACVLGVAAKLDRQAHAARWSRPDAPAT